MSEATTTEALNEAPTSPRKIVEWINNLLHKLTEVGIETKPVPEYKQAIKVNYGGSMDVYLMCNDVSQEEFDTAIKELGNFWHARDLYKYFADRAHVAVVDTGKKKGNPIRMVFGNDRDTI